MLTIIICVVLTGIATGIIRHESIKIKKTVSEAFVTGYYDMGVSACQIYSHRTIKVRDEGYQYIDIYVPKRVRSVITDKLNNPSFNEDVMISVAKSVLDGWLEVDPNRGQISPEYLGGSSEEFDEYYKGGMKFLADLDDYKAKVLQALSDEKAKKALINARKKGLVEINKPVIINSLELDKLRNETFNRSISEHEVWNKEMREIQ